MAYNPNIPQNNDTINVSAGQIRENFAQIANVFAVNHNDFNTEFAGMHKFLQMPRVDDDPETGADEGALFTKTGDFSGLVELFFKRENDGSVVNITQSLGAPNFGDPGYFYVGDVLVKFGIVTVDAPAGFYPNVLFPTGDIPVFATPPLVFPVQIGNAIQQQFIMAGAATTVDFPVTKILTGAPLDIPFFAIGT